MRGELVRYTTGTAPVPRQDRAIARQAKGVYDEARMAALRADAVVAVAGHIMQGITELDALRRTLAADDVALNVTLAEIEQQAIRDCARIQRGMFNPFGAL